MYTQAPEPAAEGFGLLLRQHRLQAGLTQEALAEQAGVSPRSVSGLERGEVQPHRDTAVRLVQALGLTPAQQARLLTAVQPKLRQRGALFQAPGDVPASLPSVATWSRSAVARGALPAALTSFIGRRQQEIAVARLLQGNVRLLTLTGPGGVGKTRLALAVAERLRRHMPGGVLLVSLASLSDPKGVLAAVAQAAGVSAAEPSALFAGLVAALQDRELLLVLDNFEHLTAAAPELGALIAACPTLRVLVTSREALRIQGEQQVAVPPLELPDMQNLPAVPELGRIPAVVLFLERARAVQPDFTLTVENAPAVAGICWRLDGLPLAIELAAPWVRLFSPHELLVRLSNSLSLLSGGARDLPARQRTLRATMEWSHRLLAADEQALFRRLAVFTGGWRLEAAQGVTAADDLPAGQVLELLARLVDTSLVAVEAAPDGSVRYRLLDTLRQYAWDRLVAAGEVPRVRAKHLAWYLALAEQQQPDQASAPVLVAAEYANLAAAFAWAEEAGEIALGLRLAALLGPFWHAGGYADDEHQRVEALLALAASAPASVDPLLRARALVTAGMLALRRGDLARAGVCYQDALLLQRTAGGGSAAAQTLNHLGVLAYEQGDFAGATTHHEEALALQRASGDRHGVAESLGHLGIVAFNRRAYAWAAALFEESLALHRRLGDARGMAAALEGLGHVACDTGAYARAGALYAESLACRQALSDPRGIAHSMNDLASVAAATGDDVRAAVLYEQSLTIFRSIGDKRGAAWILTRLAGVTFRQGDPFQARRLLEEGLALHREIGNTLGAADALLAAAFVAVRSGEPARGGRLALESLPLCRQLGDPARLLRCLEAMATVLAAGTELLRAARLFAAAAAFRRALQAALPPDDRRHQATTIRALRRQLGAAAFRQAWTAGRMLSPAEALEEAAAAALVA